MQAIQVPEKDAGGAGVHGPTVVVTQRLDSA
jgi:hypothetical protein